MVNDSNPFDKSLKWVRMLKSREGSVVEIVQALLQESCYIWQSWNTSSNCLRAGLWLNPNLQTWWILLMTFMRSEVKVRCERLKRFPRATNRSLSNSCNPLHLDWILLHFVHQCKFCQMNAAVCTRLPPWWQILKLASCFMCFQGAQRSCHWEVV